MITKLAQYGSLLRERREELGLSQQDMRLKIGMSQQQYQRIEAGSDTRLSTLLRVLEGLGLELLIAPKDQARALEHELIHLNADNVTQKSEQQRQSDWDFIQSLGDD